MIDPENFFILRQPMYPLDTLLRMYEQVGTQPLTGLLRQEFRDPLAQQALFAASPALHERFRQWLRGESLPEEDKLLVTLHKYLVRMCSRPTPYGLFAGSSLGHFAGQSQLRADTATMLRSHTRIDMDYLLAICRWLTDQPGIRAQAQVYPNSSLYSVGGSLRYVEQQVVDEKRTYFISAADSDEYLTTVLETARAGATIGQLAEQLHLVNGIEREEAAEFVEQLIEGQLLTFEFEPTVTGQNFLDRLIGRVAALTGTAGVTAELTQLRQLVRHRTADPTDRLRAYADCRQWFADRDIRAAAADIIQVDAYFDNPALQLGGRVRQTLREQIDRLLVLNQPAGCPDMDAFVTRFQERYEDEEVPLSLAVDAEYGVGYGAGASFGVGYAPLIDDLSLAPANTSPATVTWDWWQRFVLDKYVAALRTTHPAGLADEIILTDDDLACVRSKQPDTTALPDSFYAFGTLLAGSTSALDAGDFQFNLLAVRGPSAINLLSRAAMNWPTVSGLAQPLRKRTTPT
jgi:lantibiotic biosynthesis protein